MMINFTRWQCSIRAGLFHDATLIVWQPEKRENNIAYVWINKLFVNSCFQKAKHKTDLRRTKPPPSGRTYHIPSTQCRSMNINDVTLRFLERTHVTYLIFISKAFTIVGSRNILPVREKNMSAPLRMSCC